MGPPGRSRRVTRAEMVLAGALAAALVALAAVLVTGAAGRATPAPSPAHRTGTHRPAGPPHSARPTRAAAGPASALPPIAAAAALFVGDLEAGVADGQVTPEAGQDLSNHLQQLLFGPPGQDAQHIQQQYTQLVQAYDQHRAQGQITGRAAVALWYALAALRAATSAG